MNEVTSEFKEAMNPNTNCISCRLISVAMLTFSGCYLLHHRNNFGKINSVFQSAFGCSLLFVAALRALALPPFDDNAQDAYLKERVRKE